MNASTHGRITGWIISGLVAGFLIGWSFLPKFIGWDGRAETFERFDDSSRIVVGIGRLEIALASFLFEDFESHRVVALHDPPNRDTVEEE